ncbi:MAG TPA: GYF domain-containing protein [Myxococcota bacterium]|nr:GYF domain-containing protein [Myxococcota bacterium]
MRFACDSCGAQYMIADEKVGARGVKVKCKKCGNMIVVKPAAEAAAAPASTMADPGLGAGVASSGMSSMSASGMGGSFGETQTSSPAPQGELGGAFSSMFGGTQGTEEAPAATSSDTNGSYTNGNHANDGGGDSGAFGFQSSFGGHQGGDTDMALGQLEQPQAPVSSDRGGERVWYVAIEDAQVGPVNLAEVEERWDNKEIDEDTLVWKAGMADWIPLVDVPELAYLITERPQVQRSMARSGATAAAGSAMGMQAYAPQEMADEPSWRPSAASALSSLVQEELVAKKPDAPEPASAPKGMESLGLNIGANDIFGSGNSGGGTPITMGQPAAATSTPAADTFSSSGSPAWSVPSARRNTGSGLGTKIVVGLLFLAVLGLGGFMFHMMQQQRKETIIVKEVQAPAPAPTPPPVPVDPNAPPVAPPMPPPVAKNDPPAKAKTHNNDPDRDRDRTPEKAKTKAPKPSDDPLEQIEQGQKQQQQQQQAAVKEALSKEDIIDGVKANGSKLGPCVTAARSKEEIQPGRVQFVLDWNINPNGSVTAARLKGPQEVMNTSLPSCFARVMGSWKFAASKSGAPITNFPLPITVR